MEETQKILDKLKDVSRNALIEFNKTKESLIKEKEFRAKAEKAITLLKSELDRLRLSEKTLIVEVEKLKNLDSFNTNQRRMSFARPQDDMSALSVRKDALL